MRILVIISKQMSIAKRIAIVGLGPRGLSALENLMIESQRSGILNQIDLILFEESPHLGNGPVYAIDQPESNWINITERILVLDKRPEITFANYIVPEFPSYHEWAGIRPSDISGNEPDTFPPRAKVGKYLNERFHSLFDAIQPGEKLQLINERVQKIQVKSQTTLKIKLISGKAFEANEVLLAIGHQPTFDDEQIKEWHNFFQNNPAVHLCKEPYPVEGILMNPLLEKNCSVAIRGFGLAMMDVVRAIALQFGEFNSRNKQLSYVKTSDIKIVIYPFSLDGLPMSPKPLNKAIDNSFKPSKEQKRRFAELIGDKKKQEQAGSADFLIQAISPIVADIYLTIHNNHESLTPEDVQDVMANWLRDESYKHELLTSSSLSAKEMMIQYVRMATAELKTNLNYCLGQVWRHCQPILYKELSYNECSEEVLAELIKLDERIKRYSYGPPVESIQQLLALSEAGIIDLSFVNNPDIEINKDGWLLKKNNEQSSVSLMIDSVLDSPKLKKIDSSIIKELLNDELIEPIHSKLGVLTNEEGIVLSSENKENLPIAILGRLAKGTLIGVDAILECFGDRPNKWAKGVIKRLGIPD